MSPVISFAAKLLKRAVPGETRKLRQLLSHGKDILYKKILPQGKLNVNRYSQI